MRTVDTCRVSEFPSKVVKKLYKVMATFHVLIWVQSHVCIHLLKLINYT